jgi:single-stranded DNA-binding protein
MSAFASSLRPSLRLAVTAKPARTFSSSSSRSVAKMILTGRLAAEPELQATSTGQDVIKYALATSYGPKENRHTSWFRVSSFIPEGAQREYILGLQKGYGSCHVVDNLVWVVNYLCFRTLVYVEGDASMRQWEDAEGKKQSSLSIVQRMCPCLISKI